MSQEQPVLDRLNHLDRANAIEELQRCCGASRWAEAMVTSRPFESKAQISQLSEDLWTTLTDADWLEAFTHHPKIGDISSLRAKFATTSAWASGEQAKVSEADEAVIQALADGNTAYETRFGYIFIVCATGKTAEEMLALLQARLHNDPKHELPIAAEEQKKITRLRLEKLFA